MLQPTRLRQEIEPSLPLQRAFHIAVTPILTTATTLITAEDDEDFRVDALWAHEVGGGTPTLSLHVVPASGMVGVGNARLYQVAFAARQDLIVCGGEKPQLRLQPGASLVAVASAAGVINMGGWGYSIAGGET